MDMESIRINGLRADAPALADLGVKPADNRLPSNAA
jgi:hypothetical protein